MGLVVMKMMMMMEGEEFLLTTDRLVSLFLLSLGDEEEDPSIHNPQTFLSKVTRLS